LVESLAQAGLSFLEPSPGINQCGRQTLARDGAIVQTMLIRLLAKIEI
jgi:hypothetical protein